MGGRPGADRSKNVNHNLIRQENQAVAVAAVCVALLTAEELAVQPYEAYQKFLFAEGGIRWHARRELNAGCPSGCEWLPSRSRRRW